MAKGRVANSRGGKSPGWEKAGGNWPGGKRPGGKRPGGKNPPIFVCAACIVYTPLLVLFQILESKLLCTDRRANGQNEW